MKIYSADLGRKMYLFSRLLVGNWCDVRRRVGHKQVPFSHNSTFPHTQATGNYAPTGNQKTSWKRVNHRLMFIYNENKILRSRNDKSNKDFP